MSQEVRACWCLGCSRSKGKGEETAVWQRGVAVLVPAHLPAAVKASDRAARLPYFSATAMACAWEKGGAGTTCKKCDRFLVGG